MLKYSLATKSEQSYNQCGICTNIIAPYMLFLNWTWVTVLNTKANGLTLFSVIFVYVTHLNNGNHGSGPVTEERPATAAVI